MQRVTVDYAISLVPDEAAKSLAEMPENQWFERKSGAIKAKDFAVPLVAMANAEGGTIVVGLSDGAIKAVSDQSDNDLRQAAADFTSPPVRCKVTEIMTSKGRILVFTIPPSEYVHETNKGECYQRIGDESKRLTFAQRQELEWDRGAQSFDGRRIPEVHLGDLDLTQLNGFKESLGSSSTELAMRARDLLAASGEVNVAGYLLFAERPQAMFPQAHVRVMKYLDVERGVGSNLNLEDGSDVRCDGSLPQQISQATEAIERLIPRRNALGKSGRFEGMPIIPPSAWLEGLVNAVVHRSYSMAGDHIRVEIFPNRVEITSPGRFPGLADPTNPESIGRHARNPRIARVCSDLGLTRELGEGIRRIYAEMRAVGLQEPIYQQSSEAIRLILPASKALPEETADTLSSTAKAILDLMRSTQRPLSTGQIEELSGFARPTVLRNLRDLRDLKLVVWEGASPRDPQATWRVR